jgi:succinate-semialdehyde dehydrogenase/glutarate-semialdehyde dehydrogenase
VVCADFDASTAAKLSVPAKFRNAGQVCTAPTRFFVAREKCAEFTDAMVAGAESLRVGDGLDGDVNLGPLAHPGRLAAMEALVKDAMSKGAKLLTGGARLDRPGWFFQPTVLANVPPDAAIMQKEPFGPVAVINPFDDIESALQQANALPYALAAYAFTNDLAHAHLLSRRIDAGMVGINHYGISQPETPFGGLKQSGYGSESGAEGLLGYTDVKLISMAAG